jgi:DNA-binding response OmpR family regulator
MLRVLVIDDETDMRFLLRVNLEADGFAVSEASSMLGHLKADPFTQDIPVLIVTARTGYDDRQQVLERGAAAFVAKPFDPRAVGEQVRELLKAAS